MYLGSNPSRPQSKRQGEASHRTEEGEEPRGAVSLRGSIPGDDDKRRKTHGQQADHNQARERPEGTHGRAESRGQELDALIHNPKRIPLEGW